MAGDGFDVINAVFTYKNIPLYKLANYSFKDPRAAYAAFLRVPGISGVVLVQTASRVEAYMLVVREPDAPDARSAEGKGLTINRIRETWISLAGLDGYDVDHFDQTLEVYRNEEAYGRLLRLASGLESVVVGKAEILREIKASIETSRGFGASCRQLDTLFDTAILVAEKIRDATGIGDSVLTLGDVAVKMAEEGAGLGPKKKVLLVGTGQSAALVAKSLNAAGRSFDVASRSTERAAGFSRILKGTPVEFAAALAGFDRYDVVFVATTADYHILTDSRIRGVMEGKKTGTMVLDISEPRAVNENVSSVHGIKLMFRDQIAEQEEENLKIRTAKIPEAEKMIDKELPVVAAVMSGSAA